MKIKLNNVSKFYKSETNVSVGIQNVTAEFQSGEIVAIVGESGSGKSTFLNVVSLMDSFESGELTFDDCDVSGLSNDELEKERRSNVSFIFQNYNIIESYTVLQNVMLPLIVRGYSIKVAKEKAKDIINKVGLESRTHHRGTKLSGGEKQRCVIARALASDSKILACDEPTGNLDSKTGAEIMALIKEISKDRLVFIVTHNYDEIRDYATRKLKFFDGKLVEDVKIKTPYETEEKIIDDPNNRNKFLGLLKIGIDNIISAPKKSIFLFLITCCISFLVITLISSSISSESTTSYQNNNFYSNLDSNRVVVYDPTGKTIDVDSVKNVIGSSSEVVNSIYEEMGMTYFVEGKYGNRTNVNCNFKSSLTNEKLLVGRKPTASHEVVLGLPYVENYVDTYLESFLVENNYYSKDFPYVKERKYKIVGLYKSNGKCYVTGSKEANESLKLHAVETSSYSFSNINTQYQLNFKENEKAKIYSRNQSDAIKENRNIIVSLNGINVDISNYDFEFVYSEDEFEPRYEITPTAIKSILEEEIRSVSFYSPDLKSDSMIKKIEDLNLVGIKVSKYVSYFDQNASMLSKIAILATWIAIIVILFIVYLISYLVLSRVYKTKMKDYIIIRTLGLSRKSSGNVVKIENILLTLFSAIVAYIIAKILQYALPIQFGFIQYFSVGNTIIYLIVMILFSYFLASKFNRKIFAFSVQETLRGGVAND